MPMVRYSIRVAWSDEDDMFVAVCPALGGISALGETIQEAVVEIEAAMVLAVETYESEGWPLPPPDPVVEYSGQFRLRLPRSLHGWLAHEAGREGVSLNSLIVSMLARAQGAHAATVAVTEMADSASKAGKRRGRARRVSEGPGG